MTETERALLAAIVRAAETNKSQQAEQFASALALVRGEHREGARADGVGFVSQRHPDTEKDPDE